MVNDAGTDGRESGTGQDTPKVCVHVPPCFLLRPAGHAGTLSRRVPLSRIGHFGSWPWVPPAWLALGVLNQHGSPPDRPASANRGGSPQPERDGVAVMTVALSGRRRLPNRREHTLVNFATSDGFTYTAGLGYFDDGDLAEIFLNAEKIGTSIETAARDSAVLASLALRTGSRLKPSGARSHETPMAPRLGRSVSCSICLPSKRLHVGSRVHEPAASHSQSG